MPQQTTAAEKQEETKKSIVSQRLSGEKVEHKIFKEQCYEVQRASER